MIITEATLAPYRRKAGNIRGDLPFRGMDAYRLVTWINSKFFTPSCQLYEGELRTDAKRPAPETLEVVLFLAFTERVPVLKDEYEWLGVHHQAGGHACREFCFIGIHLIPRTSSYMALRQIARDRWSARDGWLCPERVTARDIGEYAGALERAGLDCDHSYPHLMEGVYPIDAVQENLDRVAQTPPVLRNIGAEHSGLRGDKNLVIVAITENSD